jgi:hypothetical protein
MAFSPLDPFASAGLGVYCIGPDRVVPLNIHQAELNITTVAFV